MEEKILNELRALNEKQLEANKHLAIIRFATSFTLIAVVLIGINLLRHFGIFFG